MSPREPRKSTLVSKTLADRLSQLVYELRIEEEKSQNQIAKELEISTGALSQYLNDKQSPSLEMLTSLAKYFKVSTDYLLGITDIRSPSANVRAASEYTGLSENVVNYFRWETHDPRTKKVINAFIGSHHWEDIHRFLNELYYFLLYRGEHIAAKSHIIPPLHDYLPEDITENQEIAFFHAIDEWGGHLLLPTQVDLFNLQSCERLFSNLLSGVNADCFSSNHEGGDINALDQEEND